MHHDEPPTKIVEGDGAATEVPEAEARCRLSEKRGRLSAGPPQPSQDQRSRREREGAPGRHFPAPGPAAPTTISAFVLSTMAMSSFWSAAGTLNLSRQARKSTRRASHSFLVMWNPA